MQSKRPQEKAIKLKTRDELKVIAMRLYIIEKNMQQLKESLRYTRNECKRREIKSTMGRMGITNDSSSKNRKKIRKPNKARTKTTKPNRK